MSSSVFVSTLEVASSRIRKRGLCASARAKLMSWRCPTERVEPRSVYAGAHSLRQGANEFSKPNLLDGAFDCGAVDARGAEPDIRFNRASEKKWILQHDAELPPQILQFDQSNVLAVQEDLSALNVVKAQQQEIKVVFPAPVCPTMALVCPGSTRNETSRKTQSSRRAPRRCDS